MTTHDFVTSTLDELHQRIGLAHQRFADLLRTTPPDLAVGGWTAATVVGHLVNVVNRYHAFAPERLAADPRAVDLINDRELADLAGLDVSELLDRLDHEMADFTRRWGPASALPLDLPLPFHGGATIDLQSGLTNLVGEFLIHGRDVAISAGVDWPVDDRDAVLLCGLCTQLASTYVDPVTAADALVHFLVPGLAPWALDLTGPAAVSRHAHDDDRPDLVVSGPAEAVALLVYSRLDPSDLERELEITGRGGTTLLTGLFQAP